MNHGIIVIESEDFFYLFRELFSFSVDCLANWSIVLHTTKGSEVPVVLSNSSSNDNLWKEIMDQYDQDAHNILFKSISTTNNWKQRY
jgi:hypothetical protein